MGNTVIRDRFQWTDGFPLHVGQRGQRSGVFASCEISSGAVILLLRGVVKPCSSPLSLQFGLSRHIHNSGPIIDAINHSCNANAAVEWGDFTLRSIARIDPNQEVTINYCATVSGAVFMTCAGLDCLTQTSCVSAEVRQKRMHQSPNFDGKQFMNTVETRLNPSVGELWDMASRYLFGKEERFPKRRLPIASATKEAFADPVMEFETDGTEVHFHQKVYYSMEGSAGGIGSSAGGGCGCY